MYEGLTMKPHKTSVTTVYGQDEVDKALIGLAAWNLNQTFNLSIEIENVKGKIDVLENSIKQISKKKKKKGSIMQQSN